MASTGRQTVVIIGDYGFAKEYAQMVCPLSTSTGKSRVGLTQWNGSDTGLSLDASKKFYITTRFPDSQKNLFTSTPIEHEDTERNAVVFGGRGQCVISPNSRVSGPMLNVHNGGTQNSDLTYYSRKP
ncbi:hypothetical protein BDN67DRAFT_1005411 [Paxillus ammoniavirescens]|nr:hypothetical protein BDN67DRAFT_1005411 [Paxillus ammoniavirescens]